jgi:hypothetical protein
MNDIPEYWVLKDTREKDGYEFSPFSYCKGMKLHKLDTGDYTILGLEDKLVIERKASVSELAANISRDRERFDSELDRMTSFPYRFLILEFTLDEMHKYPNSAAGIPLELRNTAKVSGKFLCKRMTELHLDLGIHVVYAGSKLGGFLYTQRIMKTLNEMHKDR